MKKTNHLVIDAKDMQYRNCLGIAIINDSEEILVFQRIDNPGRFWQIPQGGLEEGEDEIEGAYREVYEEIGIVKHNLKLLDSPKKYYYYKLPDDLKKKLWQGRFLGQKIKWYIFNFKKEPSTLNLTSHHLPEFLAWKWIDIKDLNRIAVDFKKELYQNLQQLLIDNYHNYDI